MKRRLVLLLLCLAGITAGALAGTPGEVAVGQSLRGNVGMQGLTGPSQPLSRFFGKPLIINVWASWCGPCRAEMGSLDRLAKRYHGRVNVIGVSTDDYTTRANAFLKQAATSFPHFIDNRLELENMFGANRIPLTLLVDAQGKVLGKYYGAKEWDSREAFELIDKTFALKP